MAHLLDKIVDAAASPDTSLPHLLRLCKVLASQLSNKELADWAHLELNGYPVRGGQEGQGLPAYRVFPGLCQMRIRNPMVAERTVEVPRIAIEAIDPELVDILTTVRCHQSIAEISDLHGDHLRSETRPKMPWDLETAVLVGREFTEWEPLSAWTLVAPSRLMGVLDGVLNRVMDLALALRVENPELGEQPTEQLSDVSEERVRQVVHNTINVHGDNARIDASVSNVQGGDLEGLRSALAAAGLDVEEVGEALAIVQQEKTPKGAMRKLLSLPGALASKALEAGVVNAVKTYFFD